jgi:hypothetical protein
LLSVEDGQEFAVPVLAEMEIGELVVLVLVVEFP